MKIKYFFLSILVVLGLGCNSLTNLFNGDETIFWAKKKDILYVLAMSEYDFSIYNECISKDEEKVKKYLKKNFNHCFRRKKIKNLGNEYLNRNKPSAVHLAPLIFDACNCTGLYSKQVSYKRTTNATF